MKFFCVSRSNALARSLERGESRRSEKLSTKAWLSHCYMGPYIHAFIFIFCWYERFITHYFRSFGDCCSSSSSYSWHIALKANLQLDLRTLFFCLTYNNEFIHTINISKIIFLSFRLINFLLQNIVVVVFERNK